MYEHSLRHVDQNHLDSGLPTVTDQAALSALQRYEKDLLRLR
jgi:hypothetical protein